MPPTSSELTALFFAFKFNLKHENAREGYSERRGKTKFLERRRRRKKKDKQEEGERKEEDEEKQERRRR